MYPRRSLVLGLPAAGLLLTQGCQQTIQVTEGVWIHEVLKRTGVPQGSELDPAVIDSEILLTDTTNGKPLIGARGRFRLVVPKDKPERAPSRC